MTLGPTLTRVPPADWPALAPFIVQHNRLPGGGTRCLHSEQGPDEAAHAQELAELPPDEAAYWRLHDGERTVALIGCEFDPALGRAWLRGPLVTDDAPLPALGPQLLHLLREQLPGLRCFDAFVDERADALNRLYQHSGFQRVCTHRTMEAGWPVAPGSPHPAVAPATMAQLPVLLALHHTLFPRSYLKDCDFADAVGDPRRLLLAAQHDGEVVGYLHAKHETATPVLYIDYLGVHDRARGQGLGRALLQAAMQWGQAQGLHHAALTVQEDREPALALYHRLGFGTQSVGVHWRWERDAVSQAR